MYVLNFLCRQNVDLHAHQTATKFHNLSIADYDSPVTLMQLLDDIMLIGDAKKATMLGSEIRFSFKANDIVS